MICCSCGKEIDINYGREYWNGIYCKKCADEMLSTPEYIKIYKRIIADLQAENAALKERLEKAVVLTPEERAEEMRLANEERKQAVKEFAERVKMAFYYEFDELIPSIMADKIDELVKEVCGDEPNDDRLR